MTWGHRRTRRPVAAASLALVAMLAGVPAGAATDDGPRAAVLEPVGSDGLWSLDAPGWPEPPVIDAASWILVDVTTGQVLDGHAEDLARPPASTTKLLTALAVTRRTRPADLVTIAPEAVALEGATAGLRSGQQMRVDDLMALLLLRSGNDAAAALAIHTAGSLEAFEDLLASEAAVLGLQGVVVREPHGLFDQNRLSARALAVIGRAVLTDARLRPLVGAQSWRLTDGRTITNRNELLGAYPGSTGLKTGMTTAAGWSLVASARRGQRHLVAVVLGGPDGQSRFTSSAALLEHGFTSFAAAPALPALRVRADATWLGVRAPRPAGLLPVGAQADLVPNLPVEPSDPVIRWSWGGGDGQWLQDARLVDEVRPVAVAPVSHGVGAADGTARLGAWLSGRVQASLRAATVGGVWGR